MYARMMGSQVITEDYAFACYTGMVVPAFLTGCMDGKVRLNL